MRENAGYEIICALTVGDREIVLGKNGNRQWVTWECKDGSDYYWGHYWIDELEAKADFGNRIAELAKLISEV